MPAHRCSADMSAKLLSYAVILRETAFVSLHHPVASEDNVNVFQFYLHIWEWVSTVTGGKTSDSP